MYIKKKKVKNSVNIPLTRTQRKAKLADEYCLVKREIKFCKQRIVDIPEEIELVILEIRQREREVKQVRTLDEQVSWLEKRIERLKKTKKDYEQDIIYHERRLARVIGEIRRIDEESKNANNL